MKPVKKYVLPLLITVGIVGLTIAAVFRFGLGKKQLTGSAA